MSSNELYQIKQKCQSIWLIAASFATIPSLRYNYKVHRKMISFLQRNERSAPFAQPLKKNRSDRKFKCYSHQLQIVFYKWYIFYKHKTLNHTRFQMDGAQMYLFMFNTQQIEFILFNRIHNLQWLE